MQVLEMTRDVVGIETARGAARGVGVCVCVFVFFAGLQVEHEVVDDQLGAATEELGQAYLLGVARGVDRGECVGRGDFDQGEFAAFCVQLVSSTCELLFFLKEREAERAVFFLRNDLT